jgi:hypothetical protein
MTEPYIRASEVKDFAFCHRAWFLERQGVEIENTEARERATADHLERATADQRGRALDRLGRFFHILFWTGLVVLVLAWILRR